MSEAEAVAPTKTEESTATTTAESQPTITEEVKPAVEPVAEPQKEESKPAEPEIKKEETTPADPAPEAKSTGSTLKLHGMRGSTCTRCVIMTLEEIGCDYELNIVDLRKGEHKQPDFMTQKQPFGQIPVLNDGDFQMFESRAIGRYLASTRDKTGLLYPESSPQTRAIIDQWLSVNQAHYSAVDGVVSQILFAPLFGGKTNDDKVKELTAKAHVVWKVVDEQLAKNKWLAGENMTIADIFYFPYTHLITLIPQYKDFMDSYPNIKRWWGELTSKPSFKKAAAQNEFNPEWVSSP